MGSDSGTTDVLASFSEPTRTWFEAAFARPTPAQAGAWAAISAGRHALVVAPTGSGKTLSAFLWSIDRLAGSPSVDRKQRTRVLYVSPLKALAVDVERNLRAPLTGIRHTSACDRRTSPSGCAPATPARPTAGAWPALPRTSSSPPRSRCS
jgi:Lhr-like helicase